MARQPTAQSRRVAAALRNLDPQIRRAFTDAVAKAAGGIDQGELIRLLESGQIDRAIELLRINRAVLFPLGEAIRAGFVAGGSLVAADIPRGLAGSFGFDGRHERAEAWVQRHVGDLIEGIERETLEMSRDVILDGVQTGRSSAAMARDITGRKVGDRRVGGFLGLNSDQTESVMRARGMLSDPDTIRDYFIKDKTTGRMKPRYKLTDRRFDKMIKKAIAEGRGIAGADLDAIMDAHKSKAMGYRGRVIAKNESHSALAAGREEGYRQALENPEVETVTIRWQHNLSQNPREDHVAMDGTVIEMGETFNFIDAAMKYPHDPAGGAAHSIGCRCVGIYRVRMRRD